MIRGLTRAALVAVLAALAVPLLALALAATPTGTRWIVAAADRAAGDAFSVRSVAGTALSRVELAGVEVRTAAAEASLARAAVSWRPLALARGRFEIGAIEASGVHVRVAPAHDAPRETPPPSAPSLPVAVLVDRAVVEDARVRVGDGEYRLRRLVLSARADADGVAARVEEAALDAPDLDLSGEVSLAAGAPHAVTARIGWRLDAAGTTFAGHARIAGDAREIRVSHALERPFALSTEGTVALDGAAPRVALAGEWTDARWPPAAGDAPASPRGRYRIEGGPEAFAIEIGGDVAAGGTPLRRVEATLEGGVALAAPHAVDVRVRWSAGVEGVERVAGEGRAYGDLARIAVAHRLEVEGAAPDAMGGLRALAVTVDGDVEPAATPPALDLRTEWSARADGLGAVSGAGRVHGDLARIEVEQRAALDAGAAALRAFEAHVGGAVDLAGAPAVDLALAWSGDVEGVGAIAGDGSVRGGAERLVFEHALARPFALDARGSVRPADGAAFEIEGGWRDLRWPPAGEAAARSPAGTFAASGVPDRFDVRVEAGLDDLPATGAAIEATIARGEAGSFAADGSWRVDLRDAPAIEGGGRVAGDAARLEVDQRVRAPFALAAAGHVDLAHADGVTVDLGGTWRDLRWPLAGEAAAASPSGEWRARGTPDALDVEASARIEAPRAPPVDARVRATVHSDRARVDALDLAVLGGRVRTSGEVSWRPSIEWRAEVAAEDLDPARHWPELPGRIGFEASATGSVGDAGPTAMIDLRDARGTLRDRAVGVRGRVHVEPGRVTAEPLEVRSGDNRLRLEGSVGERLALAFDLRAPDLAALWPGLAGTVEGDGRVAGTLGRPEVDAKVRARDVALDAHRIGALDFEARIDPRPDARSRVRAEAREVRVGEAVLAEVALRADGTLGDHAIDAAARGPAGRVEAKLGGGLDGGRWRGRLREALVDAAAAGAWRSEAPATVEAARDGAGIERLCLASGAARVCASASWSRDGGARAAVDAEAVPLSLLAAGRLPRGVEVDGALSGRAQASVAGERVEARLAMEPTSGTVTASIGDGAPPIETTWQLERLEGTLADDRGEAHVDLRIRRIGDATGGEDGHVRARVALAPADAGAARPLDGTVRVTLPDVAPLAALVPSLTGARGALAADASLGGTVAAPTLDADVRLDEGYARVPDLGIELRGIAIEARSHGLDRVTFAGRARSGDGTVAIDGEATLDAAAGWPVRMRISGERFQVANLPTVNALATPDLEISADAEAIRVSGRIEIPSARIRLNELPAGTVTVSADEEVVGRDDEPARTGASGRTIDARVEVAFGDDVRFEGFGLSTGLAGSFTVRHAVGRPPTGQGAIDLVGGHYRAYGQNLTIERGRLIFAGPVDNPGLDVRAVRAARSVTAGIEIGGTVREPRSRVFSEPPLPEAEALAYLLTGRPLSGASQSEGAILAEAAVSLGLERSELVTQRVASTLGLDTVTVGTGEGLEDSALLLGKYLTPDIYVQYAVGLFEQTGAISLEYRLTDSVSVEAASGERQSVDLIYEIERDKLF